jgi:hypothetical protein
MTLAERWLPPLFVAGAFAAAALALAPAAPEQPELQHSICLELPMTPFHHIQGDLEGCFAEYAARDRRDVAMTAWLTIEPVGTTSRVMRRSPSPMLDLCVENVLDRLGESYDEHVEIALDLSWVGRKLELSHTTTMRFTLDGLWHDAVTLPARTEATLEQLASQLQLLAGAHASPPSCELRDPRIMRERLAQLRREKAVLERKLAVMRQRAHH